MPRALSSDTKLIQIVDAALADTARRSGDWLVCKLGCTQCCVGVFPINQLDVKRLRDGLAALEKKDPKRAARVRARARASVARLAADFPGDATTGILGQSKAAQRKFAAFGNDEVCPALDPKSGGCDVYEWRPMTCRVFGPPVRSEDGMGVCELCYHGATPQEIAACEMVPDSDDLESALVEQAERDSGVRGDTIVAYCLAR